MKKLLIALFMFGIIACGQQKPAQTEETVVEEATEAVETAVADTAAAMEEAATEAAEEVTE